MARRTITVTLDADNLTWLRRQAGLRSLSDLLDQLVSAARQSADVGPSRSVVGTIEIAESDPGLDHADSALKAYFAATLDRPNG